MAVKILDTTAGEGGAEVRAALYREHGPQLVGIFNAQLSAGDVVVIYGRTTDDVGVAEQALATVSAVNEPPFELVLPKFYRAARITDGGAGEALVYVQEGLR